MRPRFGMMKVVLVLVACAIAGTGADCPSNTGGLGIPDGSGNNNGNDNTNTGGSANPLANLAIVLSGLNAPGDLRVDDSVIAVGTNENGSVEYILPSQGTTVHNVTNFGDLENVGFNVANGWVAARFFTGQVVLHDTSTGDTINVDEDELIHASGAANITEFWADGDYMVTVADHNKVDDGHKIKFIDFSGTAPVITSFTSDIPDQQGTTQEIVMCSIDADSMEVLVLQTDVFYLYDMTDPDAAPMTFDMGPDGGVTNATQFCYEDGKVIYHARQQTNDFRNITMIADFDTDTVTQLDENPSGIWDVHLQAGIFGYFVKAVEDDEIDNFVTRSVWGTVDGGIAYTHKHETDILISDSRSEGLIGYGQTLAATPDGRYRFLAGGGSQGNAKYLQVSRNASPFVHFPASYSEHANIDSDGVEASEVVTSNRICAFKTLTNNQVAFILLPQN